MSVITNGSQIEGDWRYFKGQFNQKWNTINEVELDVFEGDEDILLSLAMKLKEKYGMSLIQAKQELEMFLYTQNIENNEDYDIGISG